MSASTLWAWDDTNKVWVKVKTDDQGRLYTVAVIDELDDIGDVSVPAPTDGYILYWNDGNSRWECKAVPTAAHAATHQNGGADEINIAALSGLLADDQHVLDAEVLLVAAALIHAARHQNGGADEISVAGLSGLLADDQHVLDAEVVTAAKTVKLDDFTAPDDTVDLDAAAAKHGLMPKLDKVKLDTVDANADVTGSNAPQAHHASHENGGADEPSVEGLSGLLADDQHVLDAEAVSAMGAKADGNPLHHDRYTDAEAVDAIEADGNLPVASITFIIGIIGTVITTGLKGDLEIPFACTINRVTMLANKSGSIVVDIWKQAYADYPPEDAQSITASAPPTITTAEKSQDSTLTGWTTAIAAGDCLRFNVDSITTIEQVTISLKVTKT